MPWLEARPRTPGIFSIEIIVFGPDKPSIWICLVPVIASVNATSTDGFVSKLSERLQQAALNNSFSPITDLFNTDERSIVVEAFQPSTVTSCRTDSDFNSTFTLL